MYAELHAIIAASGGPYTPGEDGGSAQGGDVGERARRKAELHERAEREKWGRCVFSAQCQLGCTTDEEHVAGGPVGGGGGSHAPSAFDG